MNPADTQERMFDEDGGIDDDIRRPILDRTAPAPPASWSSSLRDGLRRALLWNGDEAGLRSQLGSRLATLQQQVNSAGPAAAAGGSDGDRDGLGGGEDGRANGEGGPVADDLRSLPDGANRGDVNAAARWLEDTMPFAMLLLLVFLYRHLVSILVFCWLTSMLHTANERMRRQAMLRDNRSHRALLSVIGLLVAEIAAIFLMQNERLLKQLTLCKVSSLHAAPARRPRGTCLDPLTSSAGPHTHIHTHIHTHTHTHDPTHFASLPLPVASFSLPPGRRLHQGASAALAAAMGRVARRPGRALSRPAAQGGRGQRGAQLRRPPAAPRVLGHRGRRRLLPHAATYGASACLPLHSAASPLPLRSAAQGATPSHAVSLPVQPTPSTTASVLLALTLTPPLSA